ncbi:MAG: radical SAM protein [Alistipes sp.]|nr:radical SAM protein [Alistipes sp.]
MPGKVILLVSANRYREPYPVYPLGVSYLKTYIESHLENFETVIFDCNIDSPADLEKAIRIKKPSYIGISLRNVDGADSMRDGNFVGWCRELVADIRRQTGAPIIIGGSAFPMFPREFMKALGADYGIAGEGERAWVELVGALESGKPADGIGGLVTGGGGEVTVTAHKCHIVSPQVVFEDRLVDYYWKYSGMRNIQTKRGCPYKCIYCSYPTIDGRTVRVMEPELVVDNILRLKRDKGVDYYFFTDSVFNIHDRFNDRLARRLIDSGAGIRWGAYFTPRNITREKMELYKASGLTHVEFGTESFSDRCLAAYGKIFDFGDILHASQVCLEANIYYSHFMILGGYGETEKTLAETMQNSRRLRHTVIFPFVGMRIYPDTRLREIAIKEGIIGEKDDLFEPKYYISEYFDLARAKSLARATGKAWVFPDDVSANVIERMRLKRNKKGPAWEYLRKP